jgi:glutathione synthase/RimK-type ligase-like ATP-grasp enzyme
VAVERPVWSDPHVDWTRYDAALLRTPWDYQEHVEDFLAWCERTAGAIPVWHGPSIVRWNARKTYLADLAARGVPVAPTVWLPRGGGADLGAVLDEHGWRRAFLKPVVGATARHTLRFGRDEAVAAAAFVAAVDEPMMLQPYLDDVEREGELSVVVVDGLPTHGVRKVPAPGDYRVQDDYGASDGPHPVEGELAELARRTLAAASEHLGLSGPWLYARVDALRCHGRLVLNELEVIEPSLFFRHAPRAAEALADAVVRRLRSPGSP